MELVKSQLRSRFEEPVPGTRWVFELDVPHPSTWVGACVSEFTYVIETLFYSTLVMDVIQSHLAGTMNRELIKRVLHSEVELRYYELMDVDEVELGDLDSERSALDGKTLDETLRSVQSVIDYALPIFIRWAGVFIRPHSVTDELTVSVHISEHAGHSLWHKLIIMVKIEEDN